MIFGRRATGRQAWINKMGAEFWVGFLIGACLVFLINWTFEE